MCMNGIPDILGWKRLDGIRWLVSEGGFRKGEAIIATACELQSLDSVPLEDIPAILVSRERFQFEISYIAHRVVPLRDLYKEMVVPYLAKRLELGV